MNSPMLLESFAGPIRLSAAFPPAAAALLGRPGRPVAGVWFLATSLAAGGSARDPAGAGWPDDLSRRLSASL